MDNDLKVEYMLARVLYERFCDYKQFTPRKQPYVDPAMLDYASLAVEYLGYDDDAIVRLEGRVK